jgi:hypothetical protein
MPLSLPVQLAGEGLGPRTAYLRASRTEMTGLSPTVIFVVIVTTITFVAL